MTDDTEIAWTESNRKEPRISKSRGRQYGRRDVFPETQSEIEHIKAQIAQSELIVAASEKMQG